MNRMPLRFLVAVLLFAVDRPVDRLGRLEDDLVGMEEIDQGG